MKKNSWKIILVLVVLFAAGIRWFVHDVARTSSFLAAAYAGQTETIDKMLKDGVYVDVKDPTFGATALIYAAQQGHLGTVIDLLDNHADINTITKNRKTALTQAAFYEHWDIVKLLLERGAKVDKNVRPWLLEKATGHADILKLLQAQEPVK